MNQTTEGTESLFEAIYTQRAIRRWRPDEVPDDLLWKALEAATKAPSGSNSQPWRWIVIKDPETKKALSVALSSHVEKDAAMRGYFEAGAASADKTQRLMLGGALALAKNLAIAPVLVIPCIVTKGQPGSTSFSSGSSIFPAVQNFLLAARGLGLGTVLTTFQQQIEPFVRQLLSLPEEATPVALIPVGFPDAKFGPTNRRPVNEVVFWDSWDSTRER